MIDSIVTTQDLSSYETEIVTLADKTDSAGVFSQSTAGKVLTLAETDFNNIDVGSQIIFNGETATITEMDSETFQVTLRKSVDWTTVAEFEYKTWKSKIQLAEKLFTAKVETQIKQLTQDFDDDIDEDEITSSKQIKIAIELLSLFRVYEDLSMRDDSSSYERKTKMYYAQFETAQSDAMRFIEVEVDGAVAEIESLSGGNIIL